MAQVARLVDDLGFDPVIAGDLSSGIMLEPGAEAFGADVDAAELRAMLTSPDAARRQEAAERLQGLPAKVSGPHLLQRLRDGDPGVRARAAKSLGPLVLVELHRC